VTAWPPVTVTDRTEPTAGHRVDGELGLIIRDEGNEQAAIDGQRLYFWQSDRPESQRRLVRGR
jgi:predicted lipoprotein with Yx(FWY)xxD motif